MIAWLFAVALAGLPTPVVGTSWRIEDILAKPDKAWEIDVFADDTDCRNQQIADIEACRPQVFRAANQVRIGFQLLAEGSPVPSALDTEDLKVSHRIAAWGTKTNGPTVSSKDHVRLVPRDPTTSTTLFILLIDWSGSMFADDDNDGVRADRFRRVIGALRSPTVQSALFPAGVDPDHQNGVMLLRFTDTVTDIDGGAPDRILDPKQFADIAARDTFVETGGFTHMFGAVERVLDDVLMRDNVRTFLTYRQAQPVVVLLSDGFNNEAGTDTCQSNVDRINRVLPKLAKVRREGTRDRRPELYTIGLGKSYWDGLIAAGAVKASERPTLDGLVRERIDESALCGTLPDAYIDGPGAQKGLEDYGIDDIGMGILAAAGGGRSSVTNDAAELEEKLRDTVRTRYRWYQLFYEGVCPAGITCRPLAQDFDTILKLAAGAEQPETTVRFSASPWFDGPSGAPTEDPKWFEPQPLASTAVIVLPGLSLLLLLIHLPAAWYNGRRAITRRLPILRYRP